jgi:ABC-type polysaccharide/polyol phosphate transport system ATPase subunit
MGPEEIICVENVSKCYRIWESPEARLRAPFFEGVAGLLPDQSRTSASLKARAERCYRDFYALRDVSFRVRKGESVGIIGRNGSGKSTLLQIIAGTLRATSGHVAIRGRVAALLELGSGFNPDFTGRENVLLNATILGLTKEQIEQKFDAIVDYSGIEEFIDQPVRTYSSGMTLRLAFAVCVHVDADIIIIDEALAVGDARFAFKCHATLDQKLAEGCTIIFVSHDTNSVKRLCRQAILLETGEALVQGPPNDVVNLYTKLITSPHGLENVRSDIDAYNTQQRSGPTNPPASVPTTEVPSSITDQTRAALLSEERVHQQISDKEYTYGGERGRIAVVVLTDSNNTPRLSFPTASHLRLLMVCEAVSEIVDPIYALTLKNHRGEEIFGTNSYFQGQQTSSVHSGDRAEVVFDIQLNVQPGTYFLSVGWVTLENGDVSVVHRRYDVIRFDVMPIDRSFGVAHCPTKITVGLQGPG